MRKRGTISRCCCGDGAAGTCPDACLSTWNGCAPSHLGLIYQDRAGAFANCGWYNRLDAIGFYPVAGSNGTFSRVGQSIQGGSQVGQVTKFFSFDYRLSTTIEIQTLADVTSSGRAGTRSILRIQLFDRYIALQSNTYLGGSISNPSGVFGSGIFSQINTSETETIGMRLTFGSIDRTAVVSYDYFDGQTDVQTVGCSEWVNTTTELLLNGLAVASSNHLTQFYGGKCYASAVVQLNTTTLLRGTSAQANTSNMTISVT